MPAIKIAWTSALVLLHGSLLMVGSTALRFVSLTVYSAVRWLSKYATMLSGKFLTYKVQEGPTRYSGTFTPVQKAFVGTLHRSGTPFSTQ